VPGGGDGGLARATAELPERFTLIVRMFPAAVISVLPGHSLSGRCTMGARAESLAKQFEAKPPR
jgi:hypothetical protein